MTAIIRPRRSILYLPGSNARALTKAKLIPADGLILDLEDAVAPEAKEAARALVADAIAEGGFGRREIVVRINGLETPWAAADIAAIVPAKPDAILVPKVSRSEDIRRTRAALQAAGAASEIAIWAMIETPLAILNAGAIAATAMEPGASLAAFVFGSNDLAAETRMRVAPGRVALLPWMAQTLVAARAFNLCALDGVFNDFRDAHGFQAECEQARDLGFDGKTLIHPNQVDICNELMAPSADEVAWSRTVIAAFEKPENADKAVITIDGRMVERLHERAARRTVEIAKAIRSQEAIEGGTAAG